MDDYMNFMSFSDGEDSFMEFIGYRNMLTEEKIEEAIKTKRLKKLYIPASVNKIGPLSIDRKLEIYGEEGSEAQKYAEEHGYPFKVGRID